MGIATSAPEKKKRKNIFISFILLQNQLFIY